MNWYTRSRIIGAAVTLPVLAVTQSVGWAIAALVAWNVGVLGLKAHRAMQ